MSDNKNQARPLFQVIFEDGTSFQGGDNYFVSKWTDIPKKKIKRIFYKLPTGDYIALDGYDRYFHMIEATNDLTGKRKGIVTLRYAYMMAQKGDKIRSYRMSLYAKPDDKFKTGDITVREFDINDEKIKGLNPNNWR